MSNRVGGLPRDRSYKGLSRELGPLTLALAIIASVWLGSARRAQASEGYEAGMAGGGLVLVLAGLDTTFIVATATGLTYEDSGWAVAQVLWSVVSIVGAGVGVGYATEAGFDGLIGAALMAGAGSSILLGYAIDALARGPDEGKLDTLAVRFGVAPMDEGALFTLSWRS